MAKKHPHPPVTPGKSAIAAMIADYLNKVNPAALAGSPSYVKPTEPAKVDPFFSPDDLTAINDFTTKYATDLANLDAGVGDLKSDTNFQTAQNDTAAKQQSSSAQDAMIARGLFRSSVKDAALYDIEAQRSLQNKFLNDKLTAATLNAGTQKKILGDSKKRFDEAMLAKELQNAQGVNDSNSASWADAMASYNALVTKNLPKPAATPAAAATPPTTPGAAPTSAAPAGDTAQQTGPNTASGTGRVPSTTAVKSKPKFGASAGKYYWPDGKLHSRPYRGH